MVMIDMVMVLFWLSFINYIIWQAKSFLSNYTNGYLFRMSCPAACDTSLTATSSSIPSPPKAY